MAFRSTKPLPPKGATASSRRLCAAAGIGKDRRRDRPQIVDDPDPLEPSEDQPRRIQLPDVEARPRAGREAMVVVVPPLAEGDEVDYELFSDNKGAKARNVVRVQKSMAA